VNRLSKWLDDGYLKWAVRRPLFCLHDPCYQCLAFPPGPSSKPDKKRKGRALQRQRLSTEARADFQHAPLHLQILIHGAL
jgi:hypothetical protein